MQVTYIRSCCLLSHLQTHSRSLTGVEYLNILKLATNSIDAKMQLFKLSFHFSQENITLIWLTSERFKLFQIFLLYIFTVHGTDPTRVDLIIPGEQHFYVKGTSEAERQRWLVALGSAKACLTDSIVHQGKGSYCKCKNIWNLITRVLLNDKLATLWNVFKIFANYFLMNIFYFLARGMGQGGCGRGWKSSLAWYL